MLQAALTTGRRHLPASRRLLALACVAALLVVAWSSLTCLATVAWAFAYWQNPELHYAVPLPPQGAAVSAGGGADSPAGPPVPKLLHQTWKSAEVPDKWAAARQSCIDLHPDYEHRLWTDADATALLEEHYPWFLPTYLSYPYGIQRVDSIRYFILYHYGGIYLDLDMGCTNRLDFLRELNFTAPLTYPGGLSNDIMAARPGSAFLDAVLHQLPRWNRWMGTKYVQVMFSAGPIFLTVQYSLFPRKTEVGVIPPSTYGKYDFSGEPYLYHLHGSSWHGGDAMLVFWLDRHKHLVLGVAAVGGLALAAAAWAQCMRRSAIAREWQLPVHAVHKRMESRD